MKLAPDFDTFLAGLRDDAESWATYEDGPATTIAIDDHEAGDQQLEAAVREIGGRAAAITKVNISGSAIGERGIAALGALKSLERLDLSHTRVSVSALAHLSDLRQLSELCISGTPIRLDPEAARALQSSCGWLVRLHVDEHQLTPEARTFFADAWPGLALLYETGG